MINAAVVARAAEIRRQFEAATPFRHVAIDDFLETPTCEALLRDFPAFRDERATNEMGHVGRKAVVENVAAISADYRRFYAYINSAPFLAVMSELTGIPDLIADDTLFGGGTHENRSGQALDVHVDFNVDERRMLHRRINLLVYLNKEWEEAWGGSIELHSDPRNPDLDRVTAFLPLFNRALIFETNERSWHGFRRIALPPGKEQLSRKSFSIYLYTKERPVDEIVAPHTTFYVPQPLPERYRAGHTLSESDAAELRGLMANRAGLLEMYQRLLIEKEQRLQALCALHDARLAEYRSIVGSTSWKIARTLHRLKRRARRILAH